LIECESQFVNLEANSISDEPHIVTRISGKAK